MFMINLRNIFVWLLMTFVGTMRVVAANDIFLTTDRGVNSSNESIFCQDRLGLTFNTVWNSSSPVPYVNAKLYVSPINSTVVDMTAPIYQKNNVLVSNFSHEVSSSMFDVRGAEAQQQRTFKLVTEEVGTGVVRENDVIVIAPYVPKPTEISFPEVCKGNTTLLQIRMMTYTDESKYSWYREDGTAIKGMLEVISLSAKPIGEYKYKVKAKSGGCQSDYMDVTIKIKGAEPVELNRSLLNYISDEDYDNDSQQQCLKDNGELLVDDNGCTLTWYDSDKKKLSGPYKPERLTEPSVTSRVAYVSQNCGCGESELKPYNIICIKLPPPEIDNLTMCYDPSLAGLPIVLTAKINDIPGMNLPTIAHLEWSKTPDFATSVEGLIGDNQIVLRASEPGTYTYYLRTSLGPGKVSEAVPFTINLVSVDAPVMKAISINEGTCALNLSNYLSRTDYTNLEWYDDSKSLLSSNSEITLNDAETKTFYARIFVDEDGEKCYSDYAELNLSGVGLNPIVSPNTNVCLGVPEKLVTIGNNPNCEVSWSGVPSWVDCSYSSDKSECSITVNEPRDFTLTSSISHYSCKYDYPIGIAVNTPSLSGSAKIVRSDNSADTYNVESELQVIACDLDSKIELQLPHTNSDIKVAYPSGKSKVVSLASGIAEFDADEWGKYNITYEDACPLSFDIVLTKPLSATAKLSQAEVAFCKSETSVIDLNDYLVGSPLGFWMNETNDILPDGRVVIEGIETYANVYSFNPYTVIVNKDLTESKCMGDPVKLVVLVDSLGLKINGTDLLCPDEEIMLSAIPSTADMRNIRYSWNVSPSNASISTNLKGSYIECIGVGDKVYVTLDAESKVCKKHVEKTLFVGQKGAKGTVSSLHSGTMVKSVDVEQEEFFTSYCAGQQVKFDLQHTDDAFTLVLPSGIATNGKFSAGSLNLSAPGTYTLKYTNGCETEYKFEAKQTNRPKLKVSEITVCPNTRTYVEIVNAEGCKTKLDGMTEELSDGTVYFDAKEIGSYQKSYTVNCDGCVMSPLDRLTAVVAGGEGLGEQVYAETYGSDICIGNEVLVKRLYTVPPSSFTTKWDDNPDIIGDKTSQQVIIRPNITDWKDGETFRELVYSATITSTQTCAPESKKVATDRVWIRVGRPFDAEIEGPSLICHGETPTLSVLNLNPETKYEWKCATDDKVMGKSSSSVVASPETGTHDYSVEISYRGCKITKTHTLNVGSIPQIEDVIQSSLGDVKVSASSAAGKQLVYSIGKEEFPGGDLGRLSPGKYSLHISEVDGCRMDTTIVVKEPEFLIMPFFTPNGDGENDEISIPDIMLEYKGTLMKIYDRWGKLIAVLNEDDPSWDGTYNGNNLPSGDYWYELNVDEIRRYYSGHFTLIRK